PPLSTPSLPDALPISQWTPPPLPISVVYLHNRHLSPKVRVFVDWVSELFQQCPLLSGCKHMEYDTTCDFAGKKRRAISVREYLEDRKSTRLNSSHVKI